MTDPLAFLRATHDAVQAGAEAARGGGAGVWSADCHPHYNGARIYDDQGNAVVYDEGSPTPEQAAHMARNDPAAVLRRIAAERKQLELHAEFDFPYNPDDGPGNYSWTARCDGCHEEVPCTAVRLLAEGWGWTD